MAIKPILFHTEMVRAILEAEKELYSAVSKASARRKAYISARFCYRQHRKERGRMLWIWH